MNQRFGGKLRVLAVATVALLLLVGCGGDDDDDSGDANGGGSSNDAAAIVTLDELGLDLPIELPGDLPVPSDGQYIGESEVSEPYTAVLIATDMDQDVLDEAIRSHAASTGMAFEESIAQASGRFDLSDGPHQVYIWSRFTQGTTLVVEIGRLASP